MIDVWWMNTSSFVSDLLMNPYPLRTLNHFTTPLTLVARIFTGGFVSSPSASCEGASSFCPDVFSDGTGSSADVMMNF